MAAIKWIHIGYQGDGGRSRAASQLPLLCMALHGWGIRRHFQKRITQMLICFSSTRLHSAALLAEALILLLFRVPSRLRPNSSAIY